MIPTQLEKDLRDFPQPALTGALSDRIDGMIRVQFFRDSILNEKSPVPLEIQPAVEAYRQVAKASQDMGAEGRAQLMMQVQGNLEAVVARSSSLNEFNRHFADLKATPEVG